MGGWACAEVCVSSHRRPSRTAPPASRSPRARRPPRWTWLDPAAGIPARHRSRHARSTDARGCSRWKPAVPLLPRRPGPPLSRRRGWRLADCRLRNARTRARSRCRVRHARAGCRGWRGRGRDSGSGCVPSLQRLGRRQTRQRADIARPARQGCLRFLRRPAGWQRSGKGRLAVPALPQLVASARLRRPWTVRNPSLRGGVAAGCGADLRTGRPRCPARLGFDSPTR